MRYRILARCVKGTNVLGYKIIDSSGEIKLLDKDKVEELALNKQIDNCSAQLVNGKVYLKGINCQLRNLPSIKIGKTNNKEISNKYEIVARIDDGKSNIGYRVKDCNGKIYDLSRDIIINLARDGKIINARAQLSNGNMVLRSYKTSRSLKSLDVIQRTK